MRFLKFSKTCLSQIERTPLYEDTFFTKFIADSMLSVDR
ncbi:uncharacterized protein MP3633_2945 [Marinomonas primoryensis]|jgi:hypothetical protein|uniref:Uncharacterized protein n=1 Tax=Marinomonas primoryensis TaxID=178399 RepID=A0A859CZP7_9GAMM|nr:uncharacterized protein MP3633_2945 [Marinomonas primoryensis]